MLTFMKELWRTVSAPAEPQGWSLPRLPPADLCGSPAASQLSPGAGWTPALQPEGTTGPL